MFKSKTIIMAALVMAAGIAMPGLHSAAQAATTIKIANFFPDDHPVNIALREKFKPEVESKSNGELQVRIFSNSSLGGEEKLYNSVRGGTIEMAILGIIMEPEVKNIGIIQLPFLFSDYAQAQKVLTGPIGQELVSDMSDKVGLHFLSYGVQGFRVMLSNRDISSMDDFKGLRLRFPGIKSMIEIGQALGANITPLPINEIYNALDQKVVDGVENPYPNIVASKWYELVKNVLETNHVFTPNLYLINNGFWSKLSPEHQAIVQQAAVDTTAREWELLVNSEAANKKTLEAAGVTITIPDEAFRKDLVAAEQGSYKTYYDKHPGAQAIVEKINAVGK